MEMSTDGGNRVRASDAEREEYAKMLRAAMTEGRLTLEEGEERLSRVYAAKYRDELPALTVDLPDGGRRGPFETPEVKADFERQARRMLAGHTGLVVAIAAVLVGLWAISGAHFFWPAIPLLFLTFSVLKAARWRRWMLYANRFGGPQGPWGHHHRGPWGRPGQGGPWSTNWAGRGPQDAGWGPRRGGGDPWAANSDSTTDR
jgi:DUF1707 SHOCT-like domain